MLVLSRQKNQKVRFPELGISVEILDIRGSKVRVGVDAPMEVRILRDELKDRNKNKPAPSEKQPAAPESRVLQVPQQLRHELRNALHEVSLMLHLYKKQSELSDEIPESDKIDPQSMFEAIVQRLDSLHSQSTGAAEAGRPLEKPSGLRIPTDESHAELGKALIVDDDANERELLAGFLRMCNYSVDTASDGQDALDYLQGHAPPKVILLDIHMPNCRGDDFLRKLRSEKTFDKSSVYVVSGSTSSEVGLSPSDGYTQWFSKPLDPREVVDALTMSEKEHVA